MYIIIINLVMKVFVLVLNLKKWYYGEEYGIDSV